MAQITPEMIGEKSFSSQFRGYNMDEVDDFLDLITEELTNQLRNQKELNGRILELQQELETASQSVASPETAQLQSLLRAARQRIAELEAEQKSAGDESELRIQLNAANAQIAALRAARPVGDDILLRQQLDAANAQIAELKARPGSNAQLEEQYALAKKRIAQLEAVVGEPDKYIQMLDADITARNTASESAMREMVESAKAETETQLAQTKNALAAAYKEYNDLAAQVADLKTRYLSMLENQMKLMG